MTKEQIKRYSQALKQQVVREHEEGASIYALKQKYGIGGHNTIKRWVQQYGRAGYRSEVVMIQTEADQLEVKAMKQRIVELEQALASSTLEVRMLRSVVEVAEKSLGIDFKKTSAASDQAYRSQQRSEPTGFQ
ncbi:MAG: transposase [Caldilineales bacterium]